MTLSRKAIETLVQLVEENMTRENAARFREDDQLRCCRQELFCEWRNQDPESFKVRAMSLSRRSKQTLSLSSGSSSSAGY